MYPVGLGGGGETCGGGLYMLDIHIPTTPAFAGCYSDPTAGGTYIHETACVIYHGPDRAYRGHKICLNGAVAVLSIADITDKKNPKTISVATYPNVGYAHQAWFSDDQRYAFLNDERDESAMAQRVGPDSARTRTIVFDLTDLDEPAVATQYYATTSATDHNLYIRGDLMYQANYDAACGSSTSPSPRDQRKSAISIPRRRACTGWAHGRIIPILRTGWSW